ncbi:MAG: acylphosphatase [Candidatus Micrarchaeia archaeon]|jgi:acylphosphatase
MIYAGGNEMLRIRFIASGRVQGVGFRDFVCRIGASISLAGYAKNLADGTVEIVAEGEEEKLAEFVRRLEGIKTPFGIRVEKLGEMERKKIDKVSFASFSVEF